jgi:hypothetical protein
LKPAIALLPDFPVPDVGVGMPILIECSSCHRKLRVQDELLGKTVKCPNCQTKFAAQKVPESTLTAADPGSGLVLDSPLNPEPMSDSTQPTLDLPPEPLRTPLSVTGKVRVPEPNVVASQAASRTPAVAPAIAGPQPFETPPLQVFAVVFGIVLAAGAIGLAVGWFAGVGLEQTAAARVVDDP